MTYVSSRAVAEEVVQETWLGVLKGLDGFEGRSSLKTWIFQDRREHRPHARRARGALPSLLLACRSRGRGSEPPVDPDRFFPAEHPRFPGRWARAPLAWAAPRSASSSGDPRRHPRSGRAAAGGQRLVITLRDIEGWTADEACAALSSPTATSARLLHRARSTVRGALDATSVRSSCPRKSDAVAEHVWRNLMPGHGTPVTPQWAIGLSAVATRPRTRSFRVAAALAALAVLALAGFLVWFQPQKLFIDDRVDEAIPVAASAGSTAIAHPAVRTLSSAPFRSHEHATRGRARLIEVGGRRYVRFESFHTSNGPLLRVYLSAAPPDGPGGTFDDRFVDLGALKGNIGDQNYAIPRGVDLAAYRSVVVWCKRFGVPFAAAEV